MNFRLWKRSFITITTALLSLSAFVVPACSLVIKQDPAQCHTDVDCNKYIGTQCIQGGCVPRVGAGLPTYPPLEQCSSTQECLAEHGSNWICRPSDSTCVSLVSQECTTVLGDYKKNNSVLFGALLPSGIHGSTRAAMQNALRFAIDDFARGLPELPNQSIAHRPVAVVVCNETENPEQAASFLINTVQVPAILGASFSSATSRIVSATTKAKVLLLSPTTTTNLNDNSPLFWKVSPPDSLIAKSIAALVTDNIEPRIKNLPGKPNTRLALLHKGDIFGTEMLKELMATLKINNAAVTDVTNNSFFIHTNYGDSDNPQGKDPQNGYNSAIASAVSPTALPNVIVLIGHTEGVTKILKGIEESWPNLGNPVRPFYVVSPGMVIPELLELFKTNNGLRKRTLAVSPGVDPVYNKNFQNFLVRYNLLLNEPSTPATFGAAAIYDATYLLLYASAALGSYDIVATNLVEGLKRLSGPGVTIDVGVNNIQKAYDVLLQSQPIDVEGSSGSLNLDTTRRQVTTDIQVWCGVSGTNNAPVFQGAGIAFRSNTMQLSGTLLSQCTQ